MVVEAGDEDPTALGSFRGVLQPWELGRIAGSRHLEWLERGWAVGYAWPVRSAVEIAGFVTEAEPIDPRLAGFREQWGPAAERLLWALATGLVGNGGLAFRFLGPS